MATGDPPAGPRGGGGGGGGACALGRTGGPQGLPAAGRPSSPRRRRACAAGRPAGRAARLFPVPPGRPGAAAGSSRPARSCRHGGRAAPNASRPGSAWGGGGAKGKIGSARPPPAPGSAGERSLPRYLHAPLPPAAGTAAATARRPRSPFFRSSSSRTRQYGAYWRSPGSKTRHGGDPCLEHANASRRHLC